MTTPRQIIKISDAEVTDLVDLIKGLSSDSDSDSDIPSADGYFVKILQIESPHKKILVALIRDQPHHEMACPGCKEFSSKR